MNKLNNNDAAQDPARFTSAPQKNRKPRILWAGVYSLLDTSSGAAMSVRQMLLQLAGQGYEVQIIGATVFDHEMGLLRVRAIADTIRANIGKVINIDDAQLQHQTVVTAGIQRSLMTAHEEAVWFTLYESVLNQFRPDMVFYYGGHLMDLLIGAEAHLRGIPVAFYLANGGYSGTRWCHDVDLILTNSRASAEMYRQTQGYQATPLGFFIDPAKVVATKHTRTRILFINPVLEKGVGIVIQLALLLESRRPDIVFEVVESRGKWAQVLRQITKATGTERESLANVIVTENTDDMRPVYGRARLLLAPSLWWESSGRVLAEAMLNGIPAIVTNRGGMPESILDGGLTVSFAEHFYSKPYNVVPDAQGLEGLIESIIQLYDDEARYGELAARARHVGQTLHSLRASTQRLVTALAPLLEKRAGDQECTVGGENVGNIPCDSFPSAAA